MTIVHTTPAAFAADLAALQAGDTLMLADGVYSGNWHAPNILTIPASVTVQAESGVRPVLVSSDDTPPRVDILTGTSVTGLWFGSATKPTANDTVITIYSQASVHDCTFFNYDQCLLTQQTGYNILIDACRFVNCGYSFYSHDMYITNSKQSGTYGTRVQDGINIGGQGWKYHIWSGGTDAEVLRNFTGGRFGVDNVPNWAACSGVGTFTDNVFWSTDSTLEQMQINAMPSGSVYHNLIGYHTGWIPAFTTDAILRGNNSNIDVYRNAWDGIGTNYTRAEVTALLGYSADAIDAACAAINTSFTTQSIAQILADTTIETNFAIIDAARLAWASVTPEPAPILAQISDTASISHRGGKRTIFLVYSDSKEENTEIVEGDTDDDEVALLKHLQVARNN